VAPLGEVIGNGRRTLTRVEIGVVHDAAVADEFTCARHRQTVSIVSGVDVQNTDRVAAARETVTHVYRIRTAR